MGRPPAGDRVLGPYQDQQGWYYVAIIGGKRSRCRAHPGATESEAREEADGARAELLRPAEMTVQDAIERFLKSLTDDSASAASIAFTRAALRPLAEVAGDLPIERLDHRHVRQFLDACEKPRAARNRRKTIAPSMATRRSYWKALARTAKWFARHHLTRKDVVQEHLARRVDPLPWATRTGAKQISRGKPQLRNLDECRMYLEAALRQKGAERRVAAALPLLTGVSSGELLHLQAAAIDLSAGVIHVRNAEDDDGDGWNVKTASRHRDLVIPGLLRKDLESLVKGLAPTDYLFRATPVQRGRRADWKPLGKPHDRGWLVGVVRSVCRAAGVRVTCPHGLRGTNASLQRDVGQQSIEQIAAVLGHSDQGRTAVAHYMGSKERVLPPLRLVKDDKVA